MLGEKALGEPVAQASSKSHHGAHGDSGEQAPCHESTSVPFADTTGGHPDEGLGDSGCCHSGACTCHCMQQAQAAMQQPLLITHQSAHTAVVPSMTPAHESPRLPHLIRPPIGQAS